MGNTGFCQILCNAWKISCQKYPYLVAEVDREPAGYAYASSFKARAAYDWDVEVTIYTAQDKRKQGLGRMLYEALESALAAQHVLNVNACIAVIRCRRRTGG